LTAADSRRVVIVTGGSRNIGLAICRRFVAGGAAVISADLSPPEDESIEHLRTDITLEEDVVSLMEQVTARFGRLDVLVNNAGMSVEVPLQDMTGEQWDEVMRVNVKGAFLTTRHALAPMRLPGVEGAAIVNISSIEALGANPLHAVYAASKGALSAFTHNVALEYGAYGIRCNAVAPGWINTPFNEALLASYPDRQAVESQIRSLHPVGRLGSVDDIAEAVFWLASDAAAFVTGQELVVDGGRLAKLPLPSL
jgi:meso-butanediol dehydrogenase/(S,S)-butanediol dehydrogenase/diacetyl reductase